jgi:dihydrofolate reductase
MPLSMILATGLNGELGQDNKLLMHIPEDLKHFKKVTDGKVVVMGSKTADSLPNGKPLPNRVNIVMTRNLPNCNFTTPSGKSFIYCNDYRKILKIAETEDVFIIGGSEIYKLFEDYVETVYWTNLYSEFGAADTFYNVKVDGLPDWKCIDARDLCVDSFGNVIATVLTYKKREGDNNV